METSTGTARAWAAWPVDHVALSSKRPFPASTIVRRRWRAQSASTTSVTCRSACRGTLSSILRKKIKRAHPKQSPTLVLSLRALPYPLKLTLSQQLQHQSLLSHLTAHHLQTPRLPAKLHHVIQALVLWVQALASVNDSQWGALIGLFSYLSLHRGFTNAALTLMGQDFVNAGKCSTKVWAALFAEHSKSIEYYDFMTTGQAIHCRDISWRTHFICNSNLICVFSCQTGELFVSNHYVCCPVKINWSGISLSTDP